MLETDQEFRMHYRADNQTVDGIQNEGERYMYILFNVVVALSSLTGDTIVLVASIKYRAINLHRFIVVLIQHLAVSDLLLAVFRVLPNIASLVADRWILGSFLCKFVMNVQWLAYWMTGILTICLAMSKLILVKYPLRTRFCTRKRAHVMCGALWVLSLFTPAQLLFIFWGNDETMYFDYTMYLCMYDFAGPERPPIMLFPAIIISGIIQVLMYIILPVASILLVFEAKRAAARLGEHVRWQGVLTVTLCTAIYYLSTLPAIVVAGLGSLDGIHITTVTRRATHFITNLNVMTNFFVYSLAVVSFREFLRLRLREMAVKVGLSTPTKPARKVSRPATRTQSTDQETRTTVIPTSSV